MMISPQTYDEVYLRGKSKEEIFGKIHELRQEINRLKMTLEEAQFDDRELVKPSEETRIRVMREYLKRAHTAYTEAGGQCQLSTSELEAIDFQRSLDAIAKITLTIGDAFGAAVTYVVEMTEPLKACKVSWGKSETILLMNPNEDEPYTRSAFLSALSELHMGEWRPEYLSEAYGYSVLDGMQWSLDIAYWNNQKPIKFRGVNAYPYNFESIKELLGVDDHSTIFSHKLGI